MLTMFGGLSVALALLSRTRPWWERALIVISAVPIALAVNVVRITLTGLLFNLNLDEVPLVHKIFHDAPGIIMMPLAIGFLYLEAKILSSLVIEDHHTTPIEFETISDLAGPVATKPKNSKVEV
jgi:exosortase/archaeosortase family protein